MTNYLNLLRTWYRLKTFQYKSIEDIKLYQLKRFKRLINYAYERVPMYRELYKSHNFSPNDIHIFDDIETVPVLTKEYIRKFPLEKRIASGISQGHIHKETTSGSTGEPIEIWTEKTESLIQAIKGIRFLREWGYSPFYNIVQLWREDAEPKTVVVQKFGLFKRKIVSIMDKKDIVIDNLKNSKCDVLIAVRSSLEIFGEELINRNIELNPKILISSSEVLTDNQRQFFKETFGCETLNIYGTVETGNIAWGCPDYPNNLHIDMETVIVNLSNNRSISNGVKEASIIVTNLENNIMPFIRFDPGDLVILPESNYCLCGRTLPLIGNIIGRNDDILEYKGRNYNFHFFYNHFKNYMYIRRYQIVKTKRGNIEFRIKLKNDTKENQSRCISDIYEAFNNRFYPINIQFVEDFPMQKSGKIKVLINE